MIKETKVGILGVFAMILLSGVVSASGLFGSAMSGFFGNDAPLYILLNDQWIQFVIIFLIFFGVLFFATKNAFKGERGIAGSVSFAIALIISLALYKRGFLYNYLNGEIGSLAIFFAMLLMVAFLLKVIYSGLGKWWTAGVMIILWFVLVFVDLTNWLPYGAVMDWALAIQDSLKAGILLIIYFIAFVFVLAQKSDLEKGLSKLFRRHG